MFTLVLIAGNNLSLQAQPYWQQQVNCTIDVRLNDQEHTLDAFERIEYTNNSPDTLRYIWFHLWSNAYKNDKTAFSEQLLLNNDTRFYFSGPEQRGYINRLDFQVDGKTAQTEDHRLYIDIIKLVLPNPLPPAHAVVITTPFHVKLPDNFSRGGHTGQSYQITQWYPKPAVYDRRGWHEMPYLDQGEFYSEFGDYTVRITLPDNYVVAATGELQNRDELEWLKSRSGLNPGDTYSPPLKKHAAGSHQPHVKQVKEAVKRIASSPTLKTLEYRQSNVHDFAWFADKAFIVNSDTLQLASGRVIHLFAYHLAVDAQYWKNSTGFIKEAVKTRSAWLGEYPYNTASAVEGKMGVSAGMEYPTITCIAPVKSEKELDQTIAHEVGHNWLYAILATHERRYPWMDEGMNTYYDGRYNSLRYAGDTNRVMDAFPASRLPADAALLAFETMAGIRKDQPISTPSEGFTKENYALSAYYKAGAWMKKLEEELGRSTFDSGMHAYYRRWQFRHPYPEDFKAVMEEVSGRRLDTLFQALDKKGSLEPALHPVTRPALLFNLRETNRYRYVSALPAAGFNAYDGFMLGGLLHNYQLPLQPFSFFAAPLYATRSKKFSGLARASYTWYPGGPLYKVTAGAAAAAFSINDFQPEQQPKLVLGARKLAPFVRVTLQEEPLSKRERYVQLRSYFIGEDALQFKQLVTGTDTADVVSKVSGSYYINQLAFALRDFRVLYPYSARLLLEQSSNFIRTGFTGTYFLNYPAHNQGLNLRFFAGKFFYTGTRSNAKEFETDRFHLNLTGADGQEDYTYSNYFIGRNRFDGIASQQLMIRDGGFKVRTALLSSKVGKTDNWLMSVNLASDVPPGINPLQVLPLHIPLKVFADIGTYAEAWDRGANTSRFLFDAGLQLSLFKETVNLYVPLVYSKVYKDYFRSTLGRNRFWKILSFSIDIQDFSWQKINPGIPL